MEFAAGTVVVETEGFFAGLKFKVTGEYTGVNDHFGERRLFAPEIPKEDIKAAKAAARLARTPFETLKREHPESLAALVSHFLENFGRIEVCCAPSDLEKVSSDLSSVTSLSELDALDYIHVVTEKAQGAKYDIVMAEGAGFSQAVTDALGVLLWGEKYSTGQRGLRCKNGEIQVNSKPLALLLMREHAVVPVRSDYRKTRGWF